MKEHESGDLRVIDMSSGVSVPKRVRSERTVMVGRYRQLVTLSGEDSGIRVIVAV